MRKKSVKFKTSKTSKSIVSSYHVAFHSLFNLDRHRELKRRIKKRMQELKVKLQGFPHNMPRMQSPFSELFSNNGITLLFTVTFISFFFIPFSLLNVCVRDFSFLFFRSSQSLRLLHLRHYIPFHLPSDLSLRLPIASFASFNPLVGPDVMQDQIQPGLFDRLMAEGFSSTQTSSRHPPFRGGADYCF